jgi:DNA-directed RNA polymerase subunit beta'
VPAAPSKYKGLRLVETADGAAIVLNKTGTIQILDAEDKEIEDYNIVVGSFLHVGDGDKIEKGAVLAQWDPYNIPVLSEKGGTLRFKDMIPGVTVKRELDESSGRIATVVIEHKEDLNPQVEIRDSKDKPLAAYSIPVGAQIAVNEGDIIAAGCACSRRPRVRPRRPRTSPAVCPALQSSSKPVARRTPRRCPGSTASFRSRERSVASASSSSRTTKPSRKRSISSPLGKHIIVQPGDVVHKGQHLTEGAADPHEILEILGPSALYDFLISQVQEVYRLQGVTINDKHIEIIIRQMLRKVRITDPGDTEYFWGEQVDRASFLAENKRIEEAGGKPAEAEPILLGITKASLETESFISARLLPRDDARPHGCVDAGQGRPPEGLQGKRHHGSLDPGGHGPSQVQATQDFAAVRRRNSGRAEAGGSDRELSGRKNSKPRTARCAAFFGG